MSKNSVLNTYNFVSTANRPRPLDSSHYQLIIRQQPKQARLCSSKERVDRRPVDPPPIIQLKIEGYSEEAQNFLQSPYYFMCSNLVHPTSNNESYTISSRYLAGTVVSSLHKLKDIDNTDGGFFVFGDISVRVEGRYRLRFSLFEIIRDEVVHIRSVTSEPFTVYSPKAFPGMSESTFLSRSFSDQGVRIRIRKEHRIQMKRPQRMSDTEEPNEEGDITTIDHMQHQNQMSQAPRRKRRQTFSAMDSPSANDFPGVSQSLPITGGNLGIMRNNERSYSYPLLPNYQENSFSSLPSQLRPPYTQLPTTFNTNNYDYQQPQLLQQGYEDSEHEDDYGTRRIVRSSSTGAESNSSSSTSHEIEERFRLHRLSNGESYQPYETSMQIAREKQQQQYNGGFGQTRRTTLPPLVEYPAPTLDSVSESPSNVATSYPQYTGSGTSLLDSKHYHHHTTPSLKNPTLTPTSSGFSQQPSDFYYNDHQSQLSQQLPPRPIPQRVPTRSHTMPTSVGSHYQQQQPFFQLPTPKTSTDTSIASPVRQRTLSMSERYSRSSDSNTSTISYNNNTPRFTPHFTQSPRPSHTLPISPLISGNNSRSNTSSLPALSRKDSNSPPPLLPPNTPAFPLQSSNNTVKLPPISSLMKDRQTPGSFFAEPSQQYLPNGITCHENVAGRIQPSFSIQPPSNQFESNNNQSSILSEDNVRNNWR